MNTFKLGFSMGFGMAFGKMAAIAALVTIGTIIAGVKDAQKEIKKIEEENTENE